METILYEDLLRKKAGAGLGVVILDADTARAMATFMEYMRMRVRELERGPSMPDPESLLDVLHETENSICKQLRASSAEIALEIRHLMYQRGGHNNDD